MSRFKLYTAVVLLALFSVTLVPKTAWHDCEHVHELASDAEHAEFSGPDCPVCDFTFSSFSLAASIDFSPISHQFHGFAWEVHSFDGGNSQGLFSPRAPPVL